MARTRCEHTDRRIDGHTDREGDSYILSQTLFAGLQMGDYNNILGISHAV